jgi:biopolymer transport protein ExbB
MDGWVSIESVLQATRKGGREDSRQGAKAQRRDENERMLFTTCCARGDRQVVVSCLPSRLCGFATLRETIAGVDSALHGIPNARTKHRDCSRVWISVLLLAVAWMTTCNSSASAASASDSAVATKADALPVDKPQADSSMEPPQSLLAWLHRSLGTSFTLIFLALTLALSALVVVNLLAVRRDSIAPRGLIEALELRLSDDRVHEAAELVRGDHSFLARVLAAGLGQLSAGDAKTAREKAVAAMEEFGSLESIKLHARLGYVWLIAQLAPLFGLLGTTHGLIAAFDVIFRKGAAPRPIDLAGGIGTALVATLVGLWIAIVAVAFHQIVLARMDRLLAEAGILAERFAERFAAARK